MYVQCRSSRHNDAMLSVDDFFNHGTPWPKDKKPRKATPTVVDRDPQPDLMASMTPEERKVHYVLNQSGCSNCCRCKRTASTQVSGRAKKKLQDVKEAELRARVPAATEMPAGPSTFANQPTDSSKQILLQVGKEWDTDKRPIHAPTVLRVRDSTTSTFHLAAPGDEVFRTFVVGTEEILDFNRMSFKMDVKKGLKYLTDFAQSLDRDFWKEVGFHTSEGRLRVSVDCLTLSDSLPLPLSQFDSESIFV